MAKWSMAAMIGAILLAGCATTRETRPPVTLEAIDYETGPCFGACPVYKVHVSASGQSVFTGVRNTAVKGDRIFAATPAQFAAFAKALRPYRPKGERNLAPGQPGCERAATDQPSVEIRWTDSNAGTSLLHYYFGCDIQGNRDMANALLAAPDALPITAFIDKR